MEKEIKSLSEKAVRDLSNNPIPNYYWEYDIKEFIKIIESDILDLSILEINKNLTIPELVEKAIDKIRERAGLK